MTTIPRTASYVRNKNPHALNTGSSALESILHDPALDLEGSERVWELLETPQTIETLCRALHREALTESPACGEAVESLLARLYERDLIEMTPDS